MARKNAMPLWVWGIILIVGGVAVGLAAGPVQGGDEFARGQAMGRGIVQFAAIGIGAVLVVLHFVRRKK